MYRIQFDIDFKELRGVCGLDEESKATFPFYSQPFLSGSHFREISHGIIRKQRSETMSRYSYESYDSFTKFPVVLVSRPRSTTRFTYVRTAIAEQHRQLDDIIVLWFCGRVIKTRLLSFTRFKCRAMSWNEWLWSVGQCVCLLLSLLLTSDRSEGG